MLFQNSCAYNVRENKLKTNKIDVDLITIAKAKLGLLSFSAPPQILI